MSETDPNDNPNDVDRALAAFGATPIKYRSFGKHQLRPSAAYVPAPEIVDDTVYDPFGPQPVVHALDEARIGLVLPANAPTQQSEPPPRTAVPEFSTQEKFVSEPPAQQAFASEPPRPAFSSYEAAPEPSFYTEREIREHERFPREVPFPHEVPAYHDVPAYGVPESHSDALPDTTQLVSPRDAFVAEPPPPPAPATQSWTPPAQPAVEFARESSPEVLHPVPPGHRSRMHTAAALPIPGVVPFPMQHEADPPRVEMPVPPPPPPPAAPVYSAPPAPVSAGSHVSETPEPATLPTLGSQFTARQNIRSGESFGLDLDEEPRSLVEMFRVLNGRPAPGRRTPAPPIADGTSLFRRL